MLKLTDGWKQFAAELRKASESRPAGEGWMTMREMKQRFGVCETKIVEHIKKTPMERFDGFTMTNNRPSRQVWYRPKP